MHISSFLCNVCSLGYSYTHCQVVLHACIIFILTVHAKVHFYFRFCCVLIPVSPNNVRYMQRRREIALSPLSRGLFVSESTDLSCKFDSVPFNFILPPGLDLDIWGIFALKWNNIFFMHVTNYILIWNTWNRTRMIQI